MDRPTANTPPDLDAASRKLRSEKGVCACRTNQLPAHVERAGLRYCSMSEVAPGAWYIRRCSRRLLSQTPAHSWIVQLIQ